MFTLLVLIQIKQTKEYPNLNLLIATHEIPHLKALFNLVFEMSEENFPPTHLHLVPRSIMRGLIPPLPQYAFVAW
jgi:hypothetical protein